MTILTASPNVCTCGTDHMLGRDVPDEMLPHEHLITEDVVIDIAYDVNSGRKMNALIGRRAIYTTWEGVAFVGTITGRVGHYLGVTFADGTTARLSDEITLVVEEVSA